MRYPAEDTAERHERILDAASQMFRRNGFDGVSISEVMKAAGLTHGAFYAHFESKDAIAVASVERALAETLDLAEQASDTSEPRATFVAEYLTALHRDDPARGCTMAALATDIARTGGPVRHVFTAGVRTLIERVAGTFYSARRRHARADAITMLSVLVGALVLARAVDDPALSAEILAANRVHLGVEPEGLA